MIECAKCGRCCRHLVFTVDNLGNNRLYQEYLTTHGCKIKGNMVIVPSVCQHLTENNLCAIHNRKPFLCKQYRGQKKGFYTVDGCVYNEVKK